MAPPPSDPRAPQGRPSPGARPAVGGVEDLVEDLSPAGLEQLDPDPEAGWWARVHRHAVRLPAVDAAVEAWTAGAGPVSFVGPHGAGRTWALEQLEAAALAQGRPVLWALPGPHAGAPIARALADRALPGAPAALPGPRADRRRARAAAAALHARAPAGFAVLVDDVELLDPWSAAVLDALHGLPGVKLASAGIRGGPWGGPQVPLDPWGPREMRALLGRALATPTPPAELIAHAAEVLRGNPGDALCAAADALAAGALVAGPSGWTVRGALPDASWSSPARVSRLGAEARALAQSLAAAPAGLPPGLAPGGAVAALTARRLCRRAGGRLLLASRALAERLGPVALPAAWRAALPAAERAQVAIADGGPGSSPAALAAELAALAQEDRAAAFAVGRAALAAHPSAELAEVVSAAGEAVDPVALGQLLAPLLTDGGPLAQDPRLLLRFARARLRDQTDPSAARDALRAARLALGGAAPGPALLAAEASLRLTEGHPSSALALARQGLGPLPPAGSAERPVWVELRELEARALAAGGQVEAAAERLRSLPRELDLPEREQLTVVAAQLLADGGRPLEAAERFAAAARLDPEGAGSAQVRWLSRAATCAYLGGDPSASVAHWEAAADLAGEVESWTDRGQALLSVSRVRRELGQYAEAADAAAEAWELANRQSLPQFALSAALARGDEAMLRRRPDEAVAWFDRAAELISTYPDTRQAVRLARRRAELAVRREDVDPLPLVQEALQLATRADAGREVCRLMALKALCLARRGQAETVGPTLDRAISPLRRAGAGAPLAEIRLWSAEAWIALGDAEAARAAAARALVWAEEAGHLSFRAWAEDLLSRARRRSAQGSSAADTELDRLLEISVSLARERDLSTLLHRVAQAALALASGDRAFVILLDEHGEPQVQAATTRDGSAPGSPSSSILRSALSRGREVIVSDVGERGEYRSNQSIVLRKVRSAMCVPMIDAERPFGLLYVDSGAASPGELTRATRVLKALAGHAAVAVTNARLLAESARQERLAREIAHDFRSPAASIVMAAQEVAEDPDTPLWIAETATLVSAQAQKLVDMAEGFLSGRSGQVLEVDLVELSRDLVKAHTPIARSRDRSVLLEARGAPLVRADPSELDRALGNLLSNAIRHTAPGTAVRIQVSVADGVARWVVRDHGPGVPPAIADKLFESGTRGEGGGYGLGLGISRRILIHLGGRVEFTNHPEGGAEFIVSIPLASAQRKAGG